MLLQMILAMIPLCRAAVGSSLPGCCARLSGPISRELANEGFHRELKTSVSIVWSSELAGCRLLLLEKLPAGVYVDPYQLSRLQELSPDGNRYSVTDHVDIEAMAESSGVLRVLVWTTLNYTTAHQGWTVSVESSLPLHARYHAADHTDRMAPVYIEPPEVYLGCDWDSVEGCPCARVLLPCLATGGATCAYEPVQLKNSPTAVLQVPLGDVRDLELVVVGTAVVVTASCVLLLLVVGNKRMVDMNKQE